MGSMERIAQQRLVAAACSRLHSVSKVSTLPVVALGVGVGVDYGIYIYARLREHTQAGLDVRDAYLRALGETGSAVIVTGFTLAIGVSTWIFSALKFQADMGILL
ncbi:MAG: MMPL family transporter, partial [Deltaproteobacteria bacterium]|nr:MMPL family transporter [Deltaproteobacteria bacterium]